MSDELVKRLRKIDTGKIGWGYARRAADRIEELEAKLAKAVEALERLSTAELHGGDKAWGHRLGETAMGREVLARMEFARNTLAELTGDSE